MKKKSQKYILTPEDVAAINKLIYTGGINARIDMDSTGFEVGIMNPNPASCHPLAYGNGKTLVSAINEALGVK